MATPLSHTTTNLNKNIFLSFTLLTSYPSKHYVSITNNHSFKKAFHFHKCNQCYSTLNNKIKVSLNKSPPCMHDQHKQEIKCYKKAKNSYMCISIGVRKLNYAKWELCKNLLRCVSKKSLRRLILCLGSMHISPLTALPDHQLIRKNKKAIAVKSGKRKCCQVRRAAHDSTHGSTSNNYRRHNLPQSHQAVLLTKGGGHQTATQHTHNYLHVSTYRFFQNSLCATNERTNERTNS